MDSLPYLSPVLPAIAAVYKTRWEDFRVAEILAVEPEARGDHTWLEIEKSGLTTATAAADLAVQRSPSRPRRWVRPASIRRSWNRRRCARSADGAGRCGSRCGTRR